MMKNWLYLVILFFVLGAPCFVQAQKEDQSQKTPAEGEAGAKTKRLGSRDNPVRCDGPKGERAYLSRLYAPDGSPAKFHRLGSVGAGPSGNILDAYEVRAGTVKATIYMDMYHPGHVEKNAVPGFTMNPVGPDGKVLIPKKPSDQAALIAKLIDAQDSDGETAGLEKQVRRLAEAGIDLEAEDEDGNTALLMAAEHLQRSAGVFRILLDAGADVNASNRDGNTALHLVIRRGELDLDAMRLLIEAGISVVAEDKDGDTAFADLAWYLDDEEKFHVDEDGNPTSRLLAARLLRDAGADKWSGYAGAPIQVVPDLPGAVDPVVAMLMDPKKRDAAFREILSWQKYRRDPSSTERIFKTLRYVVECPQRKGPPIHAVFPWTNYEERPLPIGHVILIDADGAIIPWYNNANSLDEDAVIRDINGDGVSDQIDTIRTGDAEILHVLPVTREQKPSLRIVLRMSGFDTTEWEWRLRETGKPGVSAIELGKGAVDGPGFEVRARFEWSPEKRDYVGPEGGNTLPFKRLPSNGDWPGEGYDEFVKRKAP